MYYKHNVVILNMRCFYDFFIRHSKHLQKD